MANNAGVYWLGADGNYYVKAAGLGDINNGGVIKTSQAGVGNISSLVGNLTQIADPNPGGKPPPGPAAPGNPNATAAPAKVDKSGDISLNQGTADAADQTTNEGIAKINSKLAGILGDYTTDANNASTQYTTSSNQNQSNLQKNKETALVNAAQGRRGLFATLSSLGALGGSGIELANRAVQSGANEDLSGAQDTYAGNQSGLDTAIGNFKTEDKRRNDETNADAADAISNTKNSGLKAKQSAYINIANDYHDMGDTANAQKYTDLAKSLYPEIATTNVPASDPSYSPLAFTAPSLSSYLVNGNTTVSTTGGSGGIPGLIASNPLTGDEKKKTATV